MFNVFVKGHYKSFLHPINNIRQFCRHLKWSYQRIVRGFSDYDTGDFDVWFLLVIPDMLRNYADNCDGHPAFLMEKYYEKHKDEIGVSFDDFICASNDPEIDKWSERCFRVCSQTWKNIIRKIAFLFDEADEDKCSKQPDYEKFDLAEYEAIEKYREKCLKKAFLMLEKYFHYIWT